MKLRKRNPHWKCIAAKHGWRRIVVYGTKEEQAAFDEEVRLIAELKTHEDGTPGHWGANHSNGGEGPSGRRWTEEQRQKLLNRKYNRRLPEVRAHWRQVFLTDNPMHRQEVKEKHANIVTSPEYQARHSAAMSNFTGSFNPMAKSEVAAKHREAMRQLVGENNPYAKLDWSAVDEIRRLYATGEYSQGKLAVMFNVTQANIHHIVLNKTWKR